MNPAPTTVAVALAAARDAGLDRLDAHWLLAHVLARPRTWLLAHDDAALDAAQAAAMAASMLTEAVIPARPRAPPTARPIWRPATRR